MKVVRAAPGHAVQNQFARGSWAVGIVVVLIDDLL